MHCRLTNFREVIMNDNNPSLSRGRRAMVRLAEPAAPVDAADENARRLFLQRAVACGAALPALYGLAGEAGAATPEAPPQPAATAASVIRDFHDPYLELVRLLREACEVEHALMLQYLYGALSLKPSYAALAGDGTPNNHTLLGVAVQEMQHLGAVNRLLLALDAAPNLVPAEFPYEPHIYPFEFNLEPLSPASLAKYIYAEAPIGYFDGPRQATDEHFARTVLLMIGPKRRPNHVGSLYNAVIELTREVGKRPGMPKLDGWVEKLEAIKSEGEADHFRFFQSVFLGTHPAFGEHRDAWQKPPTDANYPAYAAPVNPTAYIGHQNQIIAPELRSLAWLADIHYWTALLLLEQHFRYGDAATRSLALAHMLGPLLSIGRHLPPRGSGVPFDPLNFGSAPALDAQRGRQLIASLVREGQALAQQLGDALPADYPRELAASTLAALAPTHIVLAR
ncbi:MAG: hypothetical protein CVU18_13225 [Betaproteobacteria bacterium HGW-Betaproteobacteria-12]|nr:MAG: hypothetical protein CVU18_13225 [Betaproteobacteria bacterium HGW-Betaproteobacteria-12]